MCISRGLISLPGHIALQRYRKVSILFQIASITMQIYFSDAHFVPIAVSAEAAVDASVFSAEVKLAAAMINGKADFK